MTDYVVVAVYFIMVFAVAFAVSRKGKQRGSGASAEYFLGGRTLGWFAIGASLFASNIGSEHLVGLAGAGAKGDFPAVQFELPVLYQPIDCPEPRHLRKAVQQIAELFFSRNSSL